MKKLIILMAPIMASALVVSFASTASAEDNFWNGSAGDWVSGNWSNGAPTVGGGQDLFISSGTVRLTDNNTWIDNDPSLAARWGGASMTLSGTGWLQHYGGKQLRIGEVGTGIFTQTGGVHNITSSGASGNALIRLASQNGGGSGTYNLSGGVLQNTGGDPFGTLQEPGKLLIGRGGTGVMTLSGGGTIDLSLAPANGTAALTLSGDASLPGSSRLNIIGTGVTINLHSLELNGTDPADTTIRFELDGGAVSKINVLGSIDFGGTVAGVGIVAGGMIELGNFAGVGGSTTIDLIDAANGFAFSPGSLFTLDAASSSAGWNLGIASAAGSQQILQASFISAAVPEPGSALLLSMAALAGVGRRRSRSSLE